MSHVRVVVGSLVVAQWQQITASDCDALAHWMVRLRRELKRDLLMIGVANEQTTLVDAEARRALLAGHETIAPLCTQVRLVLFGRGRRIAALRTVAAGLRIVSELRNKGFAIDTQVAAAVEALGPQLDRPPSEVLALLRAGGIDTP